MCIIPELGGWSVSRLTQPHVRTGCFTRSALIVRRATLPETCVAFSPTWRAQSVFLACSPFALWIKVQQKLSWQSLYQYFTIFQQTSCSSSSSSSLDSLLDSLSSFMFVWRPYLAVRVHGRERKKTKEEEEQKQI